MLEDFQEAAQRNYAPQDVRDLKAEAQERKKAAVERKVVYLDCPGCDHKLLRRTFGSCSFFLVNYCAQHGYWIHADELAGVVDYIQRGGEVLEMRNDLRELEERTRQLSRENSQLEKNAQGAGIVPIIIPL